MVCRGTEAESNDTGRLPVQHSCQRHGLASRGIGLSLRNMLIHLNYVSVDETICIFALQHYHVRADIHER